jgi:hypothetical protein
LRWHKNIPYYKLYLEWQHISYTRPACVLSFLVWLLYAVKPCYYKARHTIVPNKLRNKLPARKQFNMKVTEKINIFLSLYSIGTMFFYVLN